ncbi:PAS domain S-box protein [Lacibacter luteus]|uniref:Sensory/regulatory protein RpfC n=1 Tax=Lacibacter luteus TaxID=2508719 RepID=A0A4Q1CMK0_9BACT|nr:PAS domain S-box protein [Lacibacter luteus]RXK62256.1 PAS domain S-box protein [Lacibacter luteus]
MKKRSLIKLNLPVSRTILLIFLLAASVLIFFGRIIYVGSVQTKQTDDMVTHTYRVMEQVDNIRIGVSESEGLVRSYLITGEEQILNKLTKVHLSIQDAAATAHLMAVDSTQKAWLGELSTTLKRSGTEQQAFVTNQKPIAKATELDAKGSKLAQQINEQISSIRDRQQILLQQRTRVSEQTEQRLIKIAVAGAILVILFIAVLLWQLDKDIRLRKKAEQEIRESEVKYRKLIEGPGIITFTANLKGEFEFISAKAKVLTGYSPLELQGKSFAVLVPEQWQSQVLEKFVEQFNDRTFEMVVRFPIETKDKEQKWVKLTSLIISAEEQVIGFQCTVKDISDEMEAESKLKESEELIQTLLNNTHEGFFMVDRNLTIRVMNRPAREGMEMRTGKKVEIGMHLLSVIPETVMEQAAENFERVFNGEYVEYEAKYDTENGVQWLRISHSPVMENGKEITGAAVVTSDISSIKQNEERIREADQKIRAMLSSTEEGFYMISPDYNIVMINEAGKKILRNIAGKPVRENDQILEFIREERKEVFRAMVEKVMRGVIQETETMIETEEGEQWYHNTYFPVRNEKNQVIAVCIAAKNITERKLVDRAWEKIREEREEYQFRLQSILDNTPLIMFIKDVEGRYLLINRSFKEEFSLTEEEVVGKTDFDFESDEDAIRYREADEKVLHTLEHVQTEETVHMADGEHNLLIVKFPLFDKDEIVYGVGGIATDITERVQARQKLVDAKKKAEAAELLQEQFLANMSHEIRTPLNGIIGMTNVLQNTSLDTEQEEFVQIIRQSSDNLLMLINDILDLSKIKAGKLSVENIVFDLRKILEQAVAPFRLKAKEKEIELLLHVEESLPAEFCGDPLRITQVFSNLLSNAMKFTEQGSIKLHVKQLQRSGNDCELSFTVSDTGIGIPEERLGSIFRNFEQVAAETTRKYGGTGLGLSITRQLCELMGGNVRVESELHKGTVFCVTLPLVVVQQSSTATNGKDVKEVLQVGQLAGKTILVAEDNEINQLVIHHVLQQVGIITTIVNNGKEAVDLLETGQQFDLIILDLQMPLMNGFQTSTYIREKLELSTPIVAMTASALRNEKMKCFELGMNEYLTKPFVPADLFAVLSRFLLAQPLQVKQQQKKDEQQGPVFYNLSHLYEMEDVEYFCEVLHLFLSTTPPLLNEIHEAVLYENWEQVYKKTHRLKSSLGILQMNLMLALVTTIEQQAKEEKQLELIPEELKRVNELYELVRPMIEAELEKAAEVNN